MHVGYAAKAEPSVQICAGFRSTVLRSKPLNSGKHIFGSDPPYKTFKDKCYKINIMAIR